MIVLGIDPGSRWIGMAVRDLAHRHNAPEALLDHVVLDRKADPAHADLATWVNYVLSVAESIDVRNAPDLVAVEAATAPNPHVGMTNPAGIIDTAVILGAVLGGFRPASVVVVPQGGHGDAVPDGATGKVARRILEASYPAALIGDRETTGRGKSPRQHARSAFDVAGAARAHGMTPTLGL